MAKADGAKDLASRVAELERRLRRMESRRMPTFRSLLREMLPPEVRGHLRAAQKEQLLAARAFLDHWIERAERERAERPRGRERITVE